MYYKINEKAAKEAKAMYSFFDYVEGSATSSYRARVDQAKEIAENQKSMVDEMYHEKIDYLLDVYSHKLAQNINDNFAITMRVPSIMVAGGANFPAAKKEKQIAALDRNMREYEQIQNILEKIRSIGTGGIQANDKNAISKLQLELEETESLQKTMKEANAYYKKTLDLNGCPGISEEYSEWLMRAGVYGRGNGTPLEFYGGPFPSFKLTNNSAKILRIKKRICSLQNIKNKETKETDAGIDGVKVVENTEAVRIQLIFDEKPSEEVRSILQSHGFRWSPSFGAWQRQLNDNGKYAVKEALSEISKIRR